MATDVHHVVKVRDDLSRMFDETNCVALCGDHHKSLTARGY